MKTAFEQFLDSHDERAWTTIITNLLPEIHEVDRNAVQIWFRFYPLELFRVMESVEDKSDLIRKFSLQGEYELVKQIDSSHKFLYGHRFWSEVKTAVTAHAENFNAENADLAAEIKTIARKICEQKNIADSLLVGIVAVALMTLVQSGLENFKNSPGAISLDAQTIRKSPEKVLADRAKNDSKGFFGFLKTVDQWTVTHDENAPNAKFKAVGDEEVASAAARDNSQDWKSLDERRGDGVIPVECRSAACGTCWVGVLGGAERLSDVSPLEAKNMKRFGYLATDEPKPLLRLSCQSRAEGAVSIVIPPWNGVFGKQVYAENITQEVLEPATTSAKENRTVVKEATKNQLL